MKVHIFFLEHLQPACGRSPWRQYHWTLWRRRVHNLRTEGITKQMRRLNFFMMESAVIDKITVRYGHGPDVHDLVVQLNYKIWLMRTREFHVMGYVDYIQCTAKFRKRSGHFLKLCATQSDISAYQMNECYYFCDMLENMFIAQFPQDIHDEANWNIYERRLPPSISGEQ